MSMSKATNRPTAQAMPTGVPAPTFEPGGQSGGVPAGGGGGGGGGGRQNTVETYGKGTTTTNGASLPAVTLPSGGGAIKGMNEAFDVSLASGSVTMSIPVSVTECPRWGTPRLSLSYDSGAGNGVFGLGWHLLGLPSIERKTANGLPTYDDEQDGIQLDGDDILPQFEPDDHGGWKKNDDGTYKMEERLQDGHRVCRYRHRLDQTFERIEKWTSLADPGDVHWRVLSPQNETQIFGRSRDSRIAEGPRIFRWLLCEAYDKHGNAQLVEWKREDGANVDAAAAHEQCRTASSRATVLLPKRIKYGNMTHNRTDDWKTVTPAADLKFHFEVVFDYGEHSQESPPAADDPLQPGWPVRSDPFSIYTPGFEVRTYRICRRILMYHNFPEPDGHEGTLVSSMDLAYHENANVSFLTSARHTGYAETADKETVASALPPVEFGYTSTPQLDDIKHLTAQAFEPDSATSIPTNDKLELQWIDLTGDGTTGIVGQSHGAWYYKRNLTRQPLGDSSPEGTTDGGASPQGTDGGASPQGTDGGASPQGTDGGAIRVELGPTLEVLTRPYPGSDSAGMSVTLVDLNSDGLTDLMVTGSHLQGYYRGQRNASDGTFTWRPYAAFESWPTISHDDPDLHMIDLTGNGRADILVTTDDVFVWYDSRAFDGFGPAKEVAKALDEERGPRILFSDPTNSIFLADMSGDGLVDIVRIRNSDICYWPNLGYGRFGAKVVMDNSPVFDADDNFNRNRLLLCDVDGSGTNDLVYFHESGAALFYNESGNGWSPAVPLDSLVSGFDSATKVAAVDLLGTGTACLVFSSAMPSTDPSSIHGLRYVDLMKGTKPHLLATWKDNMGTETRLTYRSSTSYYLQDEVDGTPWVTRIPFPVQCVDRVTEHDFINKRTLTRRYRYHHGHYDGTEREFRGFGMVEEWDTEDFDSFLKTVAGPGESHHPALHSAPVHTKSWFHVGAFDDLPVNRAAYGSSFHPSSRADQGPKDLFMADFTGLDYTGRELRDATRALKGSLLRSEEYDNTSTEAPKLLDIQESGYSVRMLQPQGQNQAAAFQTFQHETYSVQYEQGDLEDPLASHDLNLKVDRFGNVLKSVHIGYGRSKQQHQDGDLDGTEHEDGDPDVKEQQRTRMLYSETSCTAPVNTDGDYIVPHPATKSVFEVSNMPSPPGGRFGHLDFAGVKGDFEPLTSLPPLDYHDKPSPTAAAAAAAAAASKRLISAHRTQYRSDDLRTLLKPGRIEPLALPGQEYRLCLTPSILRVLERENKSLVPAGYNLEKAGYVNLDGDGSWWIPDSELSYSSANCTPENELEEARLGFFRPKRSIDAFKAETCTTYDSYSMLPTSTKDAVGNVTTAVHDYRVMCPRRITDCNQNETQFAWDALGRLVGVADAGKGGDEGDSLDGFETRLSPAALEAFHADPLGHASELLAAASKRFVVDDDAFRRSGVPVWSAEIESVHHGKQRPQKTQLHIDYQDSDENSVQRKAPSTDGKWLTSGWVVYNNKKLPVQQFEPFFGDSPAFQYDARAGHSTITLYDARDRPVATLHPDHTWSKTIYGSWKTVTHDQNSLAATDASKDADVGPRVRQLEEAYSPTWYGERSDGKLGDAQKAAAVKTIAHQNTPKRVHIDSAGHQFLHVLNVVGTEILKSKVVKDIQGHTIEEIDALGRIVTRSRFDMEGRSLRLEAMDHTPKWTLPDINGSPVFGWEGGTKRHRMEYDALRRPTATYFLGDNGDDSSSSSGGVDEFRILQTIYGDEDGGDEEKAKESKKHNRRGRVYQQRDQTGERTQETYDMSGDCLVAKHRLASAYKTLVDWSQEHVAMDDGPPHSYEASFDALGRILSRTAADGCTTAYEYDENGLLCSVKAKLVGEAEWTWYISQIRYDAHLREVARTQDQNGTVTTAQFDALSYRLVRKTIAAGGKKLQDYELTYDASGNVVMQQDHASQDVFFRNGRVVARFEYTYDGANRLVVATGREHLGQTKGAPPSETFRESNVAGNTLAPADAKAVAKYTETFTYDLAGNVTRLEHKIDDKDVTGWTKVFAYDSPSHIQPEGQGWSGQLPPVTGNRLTGTGTGKPGSPDGLKYAYDEFGNMTSMPGMRKGSWDSQGQLRSSSNQVVNEGTPETVWYVYDVFGRRVRKVTERSAGRGETAMRLRETIYLEGSETTLDYDGRGAEVLRCETTRVQAQSSANIALVERWSGKLRAEKQLPARLVRFQYKLVLDSVLFELDDEGAPVSSEEYSAYGSTVRQSGLYKAPRRYRFAGKERDGETGLYYCERRYYVPWLCRWLSGDPIGTGDGLNTYAFVAGNPVSYSDPSGMARTNTARKKAAADKKKAAAAAAAAAKATNNGKKKKKKKTAPAGGGVKGGGGIIGAAMKAVKDLVLSLVKGTKKASEKALNKIIARKSEEVQKVMKQFNQAHMIKKQHEPIMKDFLDVHSWCLRVRGPINTLLMTKDLDKMWDDYFASASEKHKGENMGYEIQKLGARNPTKARETILDKLKEFVQATGYVTWAELLDYRCHFKDSGVFNSVDERLVFEPTRWTGGPNDTYHRQKTSRTTEDDDHMRTTDWDSAAGKPMKKALQKGKY